MGNVIKSFVRGGSVKADFFGAPSTANDTICGLTSNQTLENKTITGPTINNPVLMTNVAAVAAAGSAQGDATAITANSFALIHGTGADGTKGIRLPTASAGKLYFIKNADAANAILKVYPATGDNINALAANAAISMAAKTAAVFVALDSDVWFTFSLLPS